MAGGKRNYTTMADQSASMAGQHGAKYYCHQLLTMVYGLNKSYSKKITIGLENTKIGDDFLPIIRISGNDDFVAYRLPWLTGAYLKTIFQLLRSFFKMKIAIYWIRRYPSAALAYGLL